MTVVLRSTLLFILVLSGCAGPESSGSSPGPRLSDSLNTDQTGLLGTQVGNPNDYGVSLLMNNQNPNANHVTINAEDIFSCDSQIDQTVINNFEQELNELNLFLTYFIKVTSDQGVVRNFMNQVSGRAIVTYFGVGSNLILRCQAVIFTPSYEIVYDEFSDSIYCNDCGHSASEGL